MNSLELSIIKVVAYFDVFKYPLLKNEIGYFLDQKYDEKSLNHGLKKLVDNEVIFHINEFYSLSNDVSLVERRIKGNNAAVKELKKAKKAANFLAKWFPYIKGIAISGSLSKNFASKDSDFDFFVITTINRLWICRFVFVIFHRIICLFGYKKMFCLNYMLDETVFEIDEKNIFTAIEIATLIPCYGNDVNNNFFYSNNWVEEFLPNHVIQSNEKESVKPSLIKRMFEQLLNNNFGDTLNNAILKFCIRRWQKLFAKNKYSETGFRLGGVIASSHLFKPMPQLFQKKIITSFNERFGAAKNITAEKMYFDINKSSLKKSG